MRREALRTHCSGLVDALGMISEYPPVLLARRDRVLAYSHHILPILTHLPNAPLFIPSTFISDFLKVTLFQILVN